MTDETLWFDLPLAVVDVETTGLDPTTDRIIEIAIIHMAGGEVQDRYTSLVNPERELPAEVTHITGIQPAELVSAPPFAEIADEVLALLAGRALVAYNLPFDRAFVQNELDRCGRTWPEPACIDPLIFVRELHRNKGSKRLSAAAARLGVPLDEAHRAAADAEATGHVLYELGQHLPKRLSELLLLQAQWEQQQQQEMAGWRGRRGGDAIGGSVTGTPASERGDSLGPAYAYGDDTDPVRAMFAHLPDSGSRR